MVIPTKACQPPGHNAQPGSLLHLPLSPTLTSTPDCIARCGLCCAQHGASAQAYFTTGDASGEKLTSDGGSAAIFEYNQGFLDSQVEKLSWTLNRVMLVKEYNLWDAKQGLYCANNAGGVENNFKNLVQTRLSLCDTRSDILLQQVQEGYAKGDWKFWSKDAQLALAYTSGDFVSETPSARQFYSGGGGSAGGGGGGSAKPLSSAELDLKLARDLQNEEWKGAD